jgi:hypothetical protein
MHDAARCAQSCGGASLFYRCWRLSDAVRRPNPVRTAAVERAPAETSGTTGGGGRGGSGGAAGSAGGQSGGGGTGGCAPNQVWCPGCEPGTGACYSGGCPGIACPPVDGGAGASGSGARPAPEVLAGAAAPPARAAARSGQRWWIGRDGGSGDLRCARLHERRALRAPQLRRHGAAVQPGPRWRPMSDGMDLQSFLQHFTNPGPGCEEPPCMPSRSFLHHAARVVRRNRSPARAFRGTSARAAEDAASSADGEVICQSA